MSTAYLPRIAEALSRPLLFHPTKLEVILSALDARLGVDLEAARPGPEASRFLGRREAGRPYQSIQGVAIITIVGSLANRGAYIGASSGVTSYEGIAAQIRTAKADPDVHSIVLDLDTPGGEATGMFRLAGLIREARQTKRVVAFVDDMAASAGYGIASQAHEIVISPSSIVGSIGVVLAHVDRSAEMEKAGRKVTLIHAGANKVNGNPFGPLSYAVRADMQAEVGAFYDQFLATIVAGRPRLTRDAVKATEARTFIGQAAIERGLADRIGTIESVVADLTAQATARTRTQQTGAPPAMSTTPSFPIASVPTPAPATHATPAPVVSAPATEAERRAASYRASRIASDPRVRGHQALAMQIATALPSLSADEVGAKVAALSGRPGLARTAGLAAAIGELSGTPRLPAAAAAPRQAPRSGLALAVDELIAKEYSGSAGPTSASRSGLSAAVDNLIAGR